MRESEAEQWLAMFRCVAEIVRSAQSLLSGIPIAEIASTAWTVYLPVPLTLDSTRTRLCWHWLN